MDFSFLKLPDNVTQAICATLLHSLWQGLVLALFTGGVIIFTRRANPAFRYNLLVVGLALFCVSIILTFVYQMSNDLDPIKAIEAASSTFRPNIRIFSLGNQQLQDNMLFGFLINHARTIVIIWFLIVLARTIQLLTGINSLYALRKNAVFNISSDIKQEVQGIAVRMGIKRIVSIAESTAIKAPIVIGHLKPLILIPIGLFTAIPPSAIEAIIVHELAHIARRDYLVNLMLSMIEIILFFNPAVLWIASLIRAEREHCCDAIAVSSTGNQIAYVKALITCQEYNLATTKYGMPLNGNKKHLLVRVKRILLKDNQSLNMIEKSLLSLGLVTVALLSIAFSNVERINGIVNHASEHIARVGEKMTDKIKTKPSLASNLRSAQLAKRVGYLTKSDSGTYQIYSPEQIEDQTSVVITNGVYETHLLKQRGVLYQVNAKGGYVGSVQVDGQTLPVSQHHKYVALADSLRSVKVALPNLGALKIHLDHVAVKLRSTADSLGKYGVDHIHYGPRKTGYETKLPVALPVPPSQIVPLHDRDISGELAEAIVRDGLVKNVKSYKLTETELIINGMKIDETLFQAFKHRNMDSIKKGVTIYYNFDTSRTTI